MKDYKKIILHVLLITAMYIVVTVVTASFAFRDIQLRISEALCILPMFTPMAIPALFIGCFLANLLAGAPMLDVIFGSLATLVGAWGTWKLREKKPYVAVIPPIAANLIVIPLILKYIYEIPKTVPTMMLTFVLGEIAACGVGGVLLYYVLLPRREKLFGYVDEMKKQTYP